MTDSLVNTAFDAKTGVATLTFNRPEALNAVNVPMAEAFLAAVRELKTHSGLRCVVLTGAGRAFMAGGDLSSMAGTPEQAGNAISAILDAVNPAILQLRGMDAPVIAAVKGVAAGAGLSLALMADLLWPGRMQNSWWHTTALAPSPTVAAVGSWRTRSARAGRRN